MGVVSPPPNDWAIAYPPSDGTGVMDGTRVSNPTCGTGKLDLRFEVVVGRGTAFK